MSLLLHDSDEQQLVAALAAGDRSAFNTIYRRYAAILYKYARRSINSNDECHDLIQDVFTSLWERREKMGHVTQLSAYLYRMVRNKLIRHFQHHKVKAKYIEHFTLFEVLYDSVAEQSHDPHQLQQLIDNTVATLSDRCQVAINLRLRENLSNDDIALRMNIKKKTVESYMFSAFQQLRKAYRNSLDPV